MGREHSPLSAVRALKTSERYNRVTPRIEKAQTALGTILDISAEPTTFLAIPALERSVFRANKQEKTSRFGSILAALGQQAAPVCLAGEDWFVTKTARASACGKEALSAGTIQC